MKASPFLDSSTPELRRAAYLNRKELPIFWHFRRFWQSPRRTDPSLRSGFRQEAPAPYPHHAKSWRPRLRSRLLTPQKIKETLFVLTSPWVCLGGCITN